MVDPVSRAIWSYWALFLGLAMVVIFVQVLPFRIGDARWPGPDLLTLLAFSWVMRRPDYIPVLLVVAVTLFTDLLFMRPLGLWSALVLLGFEFLRRRQPFSRDLPFLVEWVMVSAVLLAMTVTNALVLAIFLVQQPMIGLTFLQLIISILAYPVVVALSRFAFGVRKVAPGEVDAMGHRI